MACSISNLNIWPAPRSRSDWRRGSPKTADDTKHNGAAVISTSLVKIPQPKFYNFVSLFRSLRCFTNARMPGVQRILAALAATFLGSLPDGKGFFSVPAISFHPFRSRHRIDWQRVLTAAYEPFKGCLVATSRPEGDGRTRITGR